MPSSFPYSRVLSTLALPLVAYLLITTGNWLDPLRIAAHSPYSAPSSQIPLGSDELGRDLLARVTLASGTSLTFALVAIVSAWTSSILLGLLASSQNTVFSLFFTYCLDLMQTIPFVISILALSAIWDLSHLQLALYVGVLISAAPARLVQSSLAEMRSSPSYIAQQSLGLSHITILRTLFLPFITAPPAIWLLTSLPELIAIDAGFSLFGLGIQPPHPSLGKLVLDGFNQFQAGWWFAVSPIGAIFSLSIFCHFAGQSITRKSITGS